MPNTNRLLRILRHRWLDDSDVRRALPEAALKRIEDRVAASEKRHTGEIRVCVEAGLPWSYLWRRLAARDRAVALFGKLRVWDTAANNGVLIYVLMADRKVEIVADRGIAARVPKAEWEAICRGVEGAFRAGRYGAGVAEGVRAVGAVLARHFPHKGGDRNEQRNAPTFL